MVDAGSWGNQPSRQFAKAEWGRGVNASKKKIFRQARNVPVPAGLERVDWPVVSRRTVPGTMTCQRPV